MAKEVENESYLELFDVSSNQQVGKRPLSELRFIPRAGERLFFPSAEGKWVSYTVVSIEYFLGYDPSTGQPASPSAGTSRITLYVVESK